MNEAIYRMYIESKKLIARIDACTDEHDEAELNLAADMRLSLAILDEAQPEYKDRYERLIAMQKSLTPEQIDHICWQIGDWYLYWKEQIVVDMKQGTHRLGYAKEQLKEMICGAE